MQEKLNLIFDTLEQWKECQRNWIYLENIFVSADIRKARSREYQEFEKINKEFQRTMKSVHTKPLVRQYCRDNLKMKEFQKFNTAMDKIQKSLEDYLEEKRGQFPRFYFLSNDELLQILANASDIR